MNILKAGQFHDTGKEAELDAKRRFTLGSGIEPPATGIRYRVLQNDIGQILLDPVKSVPAYEAWIYENPERIASIRKGIAQAESGKVRRIKFDYDGDED